MHIANPIYNVVFKFMIEDEEVAKTFLSAVIGEDIVYLNKVPAPKPSKGGKEAVFAIYQQDFSAQIALPSGGLKKVMIELQKVKADSDITRLRPYLGMSCQTYCIFILDHDVHFPESSVIHTSSSVRDGSTGENLSATHEFFKSMYHHSWIIQIACLKQRRRNDLETLLSVFDQENLTKSHHTLNVSEDDFPAAYRHIIHRLHMASESSDIQMEMKMEDEYMKQPQNQPKA